VPWSNASTKRAGDADGSASIEFLTAGLLLMLPVVFLVVVLAQLEAASFAAEGAARQAARLIASAESLDDDAASEVPVAIELALADHGVAPSAVSYSIDCAPRHGDCATPGAQITVTLAIGVELLALPAGLGADLPPQLTITAEATELRSRFVVPQ